MTGSGDSWSANLGVYCRFGGESRVCGAGGRGRWCPGVSVVERFVKAEAGGWVGVSNVTFSFCFSSPGLRL